LSRYVTVMSAVVLRSARVPRVRWGGRRYGCFRRSGAGESL